jgi:signal transduction histidine kinase
MKSKWCSILVFIALIYCQNAISNPISENKNLLAAKKYLYFNTDSSFHFAYLVENTATDSFQIAEAILILGINETLLGNNSKAQQYFMQAETIFTKLNEPKGICQVKLHMGELHYNWADYHIALRYFLDALALSRKHHIPESEIISLKYIGKYYHSTGDYKRSITYYEEAIAKAQKAGHKTQQLELQNKIGKHYESLGNHAKALEYYLASEQMISGIVNLIDKATTYNHLGNINHKLKNYTSALNFHLKALQYRQQIKYKEGQAKSFNNLGEVLIDVNMPDSAYNCFAASYKLCDELGYKKGMVKSMQNMGNVAFYKGKLAEAQQHFTKAKQISEEIGYEKGLLSALYASAEIELASGYYGRARTLAAEGLQIADNQKMIDRIAKFHSLLSEIYEQRGAYELALVHYKLFNQFNEQLINSETQKQIADLENQYEISLKEQENAVLKRDNEIKELSLKRKNAFLLFIAIILALTISLVFIAFSKYYQRTRSNKSLSQLNLKITDQNKELDSLNKSLSNSVKQQVKLFSIISHELRNPLWWFRSLIHMLTIKIDSLEKPMIKKSLESLNESANNTFHLMDNLLHWSRSQLNNIKFSPEEFDLGEVIKENLNLVQQFVESKQIEICYDLSLSIAVFADKAMIKTVIRNLLSNAIKFTPTKGIIEIYVSTRKSVVEFTISDNGQGMQASIIEAISNNFDALSDDIANKQFTGLGLIICKEFIGKHKGELSIESSPNNGTKISFTLPSDTKLRNQKQKDTFSYA